MMTVYCSFISSMMPRSEHTVLKRENTFYLYVRDHILYMNDDAAQRAHRAVEVLQEVHSPMVLDDDDCLLLFHHFHDAA